MVGPSRSRPIPKRRLVRIFLIERSLYSAASTIWAVVKHFQRIISRISICFQNSRWRPMVCSYCRLLVERGLLGLRNWGTGECGGWGCIFWYHTKRWYFGKFASYYFRVLYIFSFTLVAYGLVHALVPWHWGFEVKLVLWVPEWGFDPHCIQVAHWTWF